MAFSSPSLIVFFFGCVFFRNVYVFEYMYSSVYGKKGGDRLILTVESRTNVVKHTISKCQMCQTIDNATHTCNALPITHAHTHSKYMYIS